MGETSIEWADYTFNPWIGCQKVSAGCKNCYASVDTYARVSASRGLPLWGPGSTRHRTSEANWKQPRRWAKEVRLYPDQCTKCQSRTCTAVRGGSTRCIAQYNEKGKYDPSVPECGGVVALNVRPRVFCASLSDVFEGRADLDPWRADLFGMIEECTELDWLLLTKRPENVRRMVPPKWLHGWVNPTPGGSWPSHVWLGTSVENQETADERIPHLLQVPAPVRFLSLEPLLGSVDLKYALSSQWRSGVLRSGLDWLIVGGESGAGARPCCVAWIRDLVRQGKEAGVATFVKQLGALPSLGFKEATPEEIAAHRREHPRSKGTLAGTETYLRLRDKKGGDVSEWPEDLRVRELPGGAA